MTNRIQKLGSRSSEEGTMLSLLPSLRGPFLGIAAGAVAVVMPGIGLAQNSDVEEFYRDRNVSVIIAYGVGGGYDAYARLLSRHIGDHIPGSPTLVPQNMTGAGGLKAAQYLHSVAPKDGSEIGTFAQQIAIAPLMGDADFDPREFTWLGSIAGELSLCVTSKSSPIQSWQDMFEKEHHFGGSGRGSDVDSLTLTIQTLFETKTNLVGGYPGTNELMLAVERGEIDGFCGLAYSSLKSRYAEKMDRLNIVAQAALRSHPELKQVPNIIDEAEDATEKQILTFLLGANIMGRPYVAPPEIPTERAQALRTAFNETMSDPEFLADAEKLGLEVDPVTGEEIDALLEQIYTTPKEVIERAIEITGSAGN